MAIGYLPLTPWQAHALAIMHLVVYGSGVIASMVMASAAERLKSEFPGLQVAGRRRWALARVLLRHAVTLRAPDRDL
jgi:hypothetical protein